MLKRFLSAKTMAGNSVDIFKQSAGQGTHGLSPNEMMGLVAAAVVLFAGLVFIAVVVWAVPRCRRKRAEAKEVRFENDSIA
jgi:cbb3-type cytochrome oxidase subunit 3